MKNLIKCLILFQVTVLTFSCATKVQQKQFTLAEKAQKDPNELILDHKYFIIAYNKEHNIAKWVKYTLTKNDLNGPGKRPPRFQKDPFLQKLGLTAIKHEDYTGTDYDRGHLAPADDFDRTQEAIQSTFVMSNVIPQKGFVNRISWRLLESKVHSWACGEEDITVYTGPVIEPGLPTLKAGVIIPKEFFKVIIDNTPPKKVIGFIYNQKDVDQTMKNRQVPVNRLEEIVGVNFSEGISESKISEWTACN
ncbi:MAG: DNA/RNA non-specific endonuclease [Bdellovibrionota bacterium]